MLRERKGSVSQDAAHAAPFLHLHAAPNMEKLVFCHLIDLEIGGPHGLGDLFRQTEPDKARLRIDDSHR